MPKEIESLTPLQDIDLIDNQLIAIPEGIESLPRLAILAIANNPLPAFPDQIGQLIQKEPGIYMRTQATPGS